MKDKRRNCVVSVLLMIILCITMVFMNYGIVNAEENTLFPSNENNGNIPINETTIPDKEFRNYLLQSIDKDQDKVLSSEECESVIQLNCTEMGTKVSSLVGIEYFSNLEVLNCSEQPIVELNLSSNTKLKELNCSGTQLTELDLYANTALEILDYSHTWVTNIDLGSNENLRRLDCSNVRVSNLDLSKNTKLESLDCSSTLVSALNLDTNINLSYLNCGNTPLTELNLDNNTNLTGLNCNSTKLTEIDLSNNKELRSFITYSTPIANFDLSNNLNLVQLSIAGTQIAWIDLSSNYLLKYIEMSGEVTIETKEKTLNLEKQFPGIDVSKISNVTGATLEGAILSGYDSSTPVTYLYDCGMASPTSSQLRVTLNFEGMSSEPDSDSSSGGGIYIPPVQKPVVTKGEGYAVTLSQDGTKATITVDEDYELKDVTLNGISLGKVSEVINLKTGDMLIVTAVSKAQLEQEYNAYLKAGVEATTLKIYSERVASSGNQKGWIRINWVKSKGFKVDGYEVYRGKTKSTMKRYDTTKGTAYKNANYLKKGQRYYYKVRGYRTIDGQTVYTNWSKTIYRIAK